ncbi:MAG: response regulator transcription factor, partial [Bdellovibrionales bacterium]|nr:response regulator transcription factor [Bdellovibrionales bacterium]
MTHMYEGKKVLIVDDELEYQMEVSSYLVGRGFFVYPKKNKQEFLDSLNSDSPDIALIDKQIGFEDGFDLIHEVRQHRELKNIPIIVVTGSTEFENKIEAIKLGADDLVHKPVSLPDLELKIIASLRRSGSYHVNEQILSFKDIEINLRTHKVSIDGSEIDLTNTEYKIFFELVAKKGEILNREQIAHRFLSLNNSSVRTLDVHINSLRKKLGTHAERIKTIRGRGYM